MKTTLTLALTLFLGGMVNPASAQTTTRGPSVSFLPRSEFHMNAEHLGGIDDERFRWDADLGGELDLVDYTRGRLIFAAKISRPFV